MTSAELSIIIPVYDEEENLSRVREAFEQYFLSAKIPSKVIFVNDGSRDDSLQIIREMNKANPLFTYISFEKNFGLSAAIKAGFDHADTKWVGYIDADLQTTPEDFNILADYCNEYDLVTGVRTGRKDSFTKKVSSKIANSIRRSFTHDGMDDTGCPLKIIQTEKAKHIPMFNGLHRFLPAMILLQKGKIIQIPVRAFPRVAGKSHFHLWNRLVGPLSDCFAYVWMKRKYISYKVAEKSV
jgi:glycosyltransferase involved in cell wall biosynthesis